MTERRGGASTDRLARPVNQRTRQPVLLTRCNYWIHYLLFLALSVSNIGWAFAGTIDRVQLQALLPAPLVVGELDARLPIRPVFEPNGSAKRLRGYVFETIDFEPARGYSGKPINLLVTLDADGVFLGVHLLAHREPIFVNPRGHQLLLEFARQYEGLSLRHNVQIVGAKEPTQRTADSATVNGVTQGTVSVRAMDRAIMQSAITVARAVIDQRNAKDSTTANVVVNQAHTPMPWPQLLTQQWLQHLELSERDIERAFAGTAAARGESQPSDANRLPAVDLWLGLVSHAQVGRNLLDAAGWNYVRSIAQTGQQVVLVVERGPVEIYSPGRASPANRAGGAPADASSSRSSVSANRSVAEAPALPRISLRQRAQTFELQEIDFDYVPMLPTQLMSGNVPPRTRLFRTIDGDDLKAAESMEVALSFDRRYGSDALQRVRREWTLPFPDRPVMVTTSEVGALATITQSNDADWLAAWRARAVELAILCVALAVLTVMLARPRWLSATPRRLARFRVAYLTFTLVFVGWIAQAQLSIVNITALIEALRSGESGRFLLFDPLTVFLWLFVLLSLIVWGRGTFCGWLCPFGAMQELMSLIAKRFGFRQRRLPAQLDRRLKAIKYLVLVALIGSALSLSPWTDQAVEVEPFKTAISMGFDRAWPFVAWALLCAASSVFVFRGYCRYVCPLGAALAVLGSVRLLDWIPRRPECGTPCQSCRYRCEYQAIAPTGKIDYRECFQCLDCVEIYQDPKRCLPLIRIAREPVRH